MAYILKLLDERSMAPRQGDGGVVLFLRMSETGYRGRALIVGPDGRPLREGVRVTSTCPVAATQDLYLACTSAGWPMESIGVAADSQFRTDEIMRGGQPIQAIDWSANHRSVIDILADSFGPSAQLQVQPQPQPQPQPQIERAPQAPRSGQRALPAPPESSTALVAPASRPSRRSLEGIGDDEQQVLLALSGAAKKIRAGEKVSDILPFLGEALSPFMDEAVDDLDGFDSEDDDDEDLDEDGEPAEDGGFNGDDVDHAAAPTEVRAMRVLMPGEVPPGLTPDQVAQFSAFSDPAAEQKMRRSFERANSATAHARAIAEANERARAAALASPAQAPSAEPVLTPARPALLAAVRQPRPASAPPPLPQPLQPPQPPQPAPEAPVEPQPADSLGQIWVVDPSAPALPPAPSGPPLRSARLAAPFGEPIQLYERLWYSVEQVAGAFDVTAATIRNKIKDGSIVGVIRTPVPGARGVPRLLIPVEAVG